MAGSATRAGRTLIVVGLLAVAAVAVVVVWMVVDLFRASGPGTAQFEPSLPLVAGLRADGDALVVDPGTPCESVDQLWLLFRSDDAPSVRTVLDADAPQTVDSFTVGADLPGFTVREPLPPGFDWRDYDAVDLGTDSATGFAGTTSVELQPVVDGATEHAGDDTFYVTDAGWLTHDEILAGNTEEFLTMCTPDPAREQR
ncbi:hypothetical protein CLV56_1262 [Mumia flava]|uniref:Uncharacterized protein n=1 Tax=Mumia flava TaxID=1348852 RepID=A0A2M9BGG3_9ACTN|nr:hypothetical protein [Mumia flava]PJJ57043.1 hypothetical protein CLV56_1262 [Mumia flava]